MARHSDFIAAFPSASELDASVIDALLASTTRIELMEGSVLFDAGDPPDAAFLLLEGAVRVEHRLESGGSIPLGRLSPGHVVGDMGLLDGAPRSATAVVEQPVVGLRMELSAYERLRERGHPAAIWLLSEIEDRMSERIDRMYDRICRLRDEPNLADELPTVDKPPPGFWERVRDWFRRSA